MFQEPCENAVASNAFIILPLLLFFFCWRSSLSARQANYKLHSKGSNISKKAMDCCFSLLAIVGNIYLQN